MEIIIAQGMNHFQNASNTAIRKKRVYTTTVGCIENALIASRLDALFRQNDWELVDNARDADLILVNTCGMSEAQQANSLKLINKMRHQTQGLKKVVVTGCLSEINPTSIMENCKGVQIVSPKDYRPLERLIESNVHVDDLAVSDIPTKYMRQRLRNLTLVGHCIGLLKRFNIPHPPYWDRVFNAFEQSSWYYVHISTGCIYRCSYCAIRLAKGPIKSQPMERVIEQVRRGIAKGQKRIVLVGEDTSSYGLDIGTSLGELLCQLTALPGDFNIYVRSVHPAGLLKQLDRIKTAVSTGKIKALTVPIQSADNDLLRKMRRNYNVDELIGALKALSAANPSLLLLTHVLAGFPGETHAQFKKTLKMIKDLPFDGIAPDCFSAREGTEAFQMSGQLGKRLKRRRYYQLYLSIIYRVYLNSLRWNRRTLADTDSPVFGKPAASDPVRQSLHQQACGK